MPEHVATYVQIASIIVYVLTVFGLYKLLTSQKDATIQALNAQIDLLNVQLKQAELNTPDVAVDVMSKRVKVITEELVRLNVDNDASVEKIAAKERELAEANNDITNMRLYLERAEEKLEPFFCPKCRSVLALRAYPGEKEHYTEEEYYDVHELITYGCGYTLLDGKQIGECSNRINAS